MSRSLGFHFLMKARIWRFLSLLSIHKLIRLTFTTQTPENCPNSDSFSNTLSPAVSSAETWPERCKTFFFSRDCHKIWPLKYEIPLQSSCYSEFSQFTVQHRTPTPAVECIAIAKTFKTCDIFCEKSEMLSASSFVCTWHFLIRSWSWNSTRMILEKHCTGTMTKLQEPTEATSSNRFCWLSKTLMQLS